MKKKLGNFDKYKDTIRMDTFVSLYLNDGNFIECKNLTHKELKMFDIPYVISVSYDFVEANKELVLNGHKILLFTSFKTALNLVKDALDEENISSYTIAGDVSASKRKMLVDAFNKDQTNVFLIMLKSGGTGLNLTSADVVIHLDLWWNPQAENQATDRTHRIGQTKTVEVIKLICKGTIEEKILDLQQKKKLLSDSLIEGDMDDTTILKNLTEKDIRNLLSYENKD